MWNSVVGFLPILGWLPTYSCKQNLLGDVFGGLTVGVMRVPQGELFQGENLQVSPMRFWQR